MRLSDRRRILWRTPEEKELLAMEGPTYNTGLVRPEVERCV
jgi:hypothetical protein